MSTIIGLLVLVSLCVGGYFLYKKFSSLVENSGGAVSDDENPVEELSTDLIEDKQKCLVEVAKNVSLSDSIPDGLKERTHVLIRCVWDILEPLNEKYPSQDVTFRVNRIASSHLGELVNDFNSLTNKSQDDINNFSKQVETMQKGVDLAKESLEMDSQAKFDSTAAFLDGMHGKN